MKFEITSFVAAFVVYLVRLRVQYASGTRSLHSGSYMEHCSHLYRPEAAASPEKPQPEANDYAAGDSSATQGRAGNSSGMHTSTSFARGCSRAV